MKTVDINVNAWKIWEAVQSLTMSMEEEPEDAKTWTEMLVNNEDEEKKRKLSVAIRLDVCSMVYVVSPCGDDMCCGATELH